ncbi:hypothetical protein [Halorubrum halodurans]|uniref:Uncharacterized protein n=1 Tax=Halorubrum halodurans TaxID=1383851 RepID=A0A256IJG4_9EURY|nr:hypothetical protein [Halorubrum halodurans]OYR56654.1 hypothetical protein DJ70_08030 [Halorubrum halodurans]
MTDAYLAAETEAELYDAHTEPDIEPPTRAEPAITTSNTQHTGRETGTEEIDTDFSGIDIPGAGTTDTSEPSSVDSVDTDALGTVTIDELAPGIAAAESGADLYITDQWTNEYGTDRVAIDGDTHPAKDIIKFDWDTTHHEFDPETNQWIVDAAAVDELHDRLEAAGYETGF